MLPQHVVDARLPARPGRAEALDHVGVEAEAHQTLGRIQPGPAAEAAVEIAGICGRCRAHPVELRFVERLGSGVGEGRNRNRNRNRPVSSSSVMEASFSRALVRAVR
jgi:hypothetical protein